MACQEMELYYAYLNALEEEKRKAQPWQCEVTVIASPDDAASEPKPAQGRTVPTKRAFACDESE